MVVAVLYLVQVYLPTDGVGLASESASHASLCQEQPAMEVDAPTVSHLPVVMIRLMLQMLFELTLVLWPIFHECLIQNGFRF